MASHTKGVTVNQFCALRTDSCDCGNKYQENCKPSWATFKYPQKYNLSSQRRAFEAHHLLCVASVTKIVAIDPDLNDVIKQTKWCINQKDNMIGLPMWAHTLRYYCNLIAGTVRTVAQDDGTKKSRMAPPPFQNLVQHDYDHGAYIDEVDAELAKIVKQMKKAVKAHEERKDELRDKLNKLIRSTRSTITRKGMRGGGTHKCWEKGMNDPKSDWYLPFSMASNAKAGKRTFPMGKNQLAKKILSLVEVFLR
jgi:hypothetical protein